MPLAFIQKYVSELYMGVEVLCVTLRKDMPTEEDGGIEGSGIYDGQNCARM